MAIKNEDIWRGIDRLAETSGYSVSGMARQAGLDPTTFNPSKRIGPDGKERWPTTESIAKILDATDTSIGQFAALMFEEPAGSVSVTLPAMTASDAISGSIFDEDGYPMGTGWDKRTFPELPDPDAFGIEMDDDSLMPVLRAGDMIVVSPGASVRRNDRVLIRMRSGGPLLIRLLVRITAHRAEFASISTGAREEVMSADIAWMSRIVWISQ